MSNDPFSVVTIKEPARQPDLREAFRMIGSTPVTRDWLERHTGVGQAGLTLIEVLIMKLYKRAVEEDDMAALDRILKYCDAEASQGGGMVNISVKGAGQLEHGAQAILERLQQAIDVTPEPEHEIPEF